MPLLGLRLANSTYTIQYTEFNRATRCMTIKDFVIFSGIILSFASLIITYFKTKTEIIQSKERLKQISTDIQKNELEIQRVERMPAENAAQLRMKERIDSHANFLGELEILSSIRHRDTDNETKKKIVSDTVDIINAAIFGRFGLLASHETREVTLRMREICGRYIEDTVEFAQVVNAAYKVHQMLRADVGVPQPNLKTSLEKIGTGAKAVNSVEIEALVSEIIHVNWKEHRLD